jgi:DNA-binding NtrC family response regulator
MTKTDKFPVARILIIDDDTKLCRLLHGLVKGLGHTPDTANTMVQGLELAYTGDYDLILLDLQLPDGDGLQALPELLRAPSHPEVIIITGSGIQGAELAFTHGAWDYVPKPFLMQEISLPIARALQYREEKHAVHPVKTLDRVGIIGSSAGIAHCLEAVGRASPSDASVLIRGETGTGKELFARAIHANSRRCSANFIVVDCGAVPETLVESILFGHEKGAFTGAERRREGLLQQAQGGTLFLDEIGELPYAMQKALLRAIQEKQVRPLGSAQEVAVDFRVVAATNKDLDTMVRGHTFREDLLYRIRAMEIILPPLRERREDIPEIAIRKIQRLCQQYGMSIKGISQEFLDILSAQNWPGNVRELINVLEYALASAGADPTLYPKHIPHTYRAAVLRTDEKDQTQKSHAAEDGPSDTRDLPPLSEFRSRYERSYLSLLLEKTRGNRQLACELSGISQSQLYALLKKHNLTGFRP